MYIYKLDLFFAPSIERERDVLTDRFTPILIELES